MSTVHERPATAAEQYAQAHATHYTGRDLLGALRAYGEIIDAHPSAVEAGYARSQVRNIVNLVVPAEVLLASQIALAAGHLRRDGGEAAAAVIL